MDNVTWIPVFAYLGAIGLFILGIAAMVFYTNLIRIILGLLLLEAGVNLFLITVGYSTNSTAPILTDSSINPLNTVNMVDPIPQALVLTAIVIGVGVQALALALVIKIYQSFGTLEVPQLAAKVAALPATHSESSQTTITSIQAGTGVPLSSPSNEKEQTT